MQRVTLLSWNELIDLKIIGSIIHYKDMKKT